MPKYRCINLECSQYDREITIAHVKMIYNKLTDELENKDPIICRDCGQDLEYIKQEGPITCRFNAFESQSPQRKREILHKRSQDHFKKHDKGDLDNYKKSITDNIRKKVEGRE